MEKLLNIQELDSLSKGAFIQTLQVFYKNKKETNLAHIKESSIKNDRETTTVIYIESWFIKLIIKDL